jgi:hypothetical protein
MFDPRVKSLLHGKCTAQFTFEYPNDDDTVSFALMAPYTYEDLNMDCHRWSLSIKKAKNLYITADQVSLERNSSATL